MGRQGLAGTFGYLRRQTSARALPAQTPGWEAARGPGQQLPVTEHLQALMGVRHPRRNPCLALNLQSTLTAPGKATVPTWACSSPCTGGPQGQDLVSSTTPCTDQSFKNPDST